MGILSLIRIATSVTSPNSCKQSLRQKLQIISKNVNSLLLFLVIDRAAVARGLTAASPLVATRQFVFLDCGERM